MIKQNAIFRSAALGLLALLVFPWLPVSAHAQSLDGAVAGLGAKGFTAKIAAVEALAASGQPKAVPVLEAFLQGRLFTQKSDGRVVIAEKSAEKYLIKGALTLESLGAAEASALKKIRINNRLRKMVRGALGGLTLLSPDRTVRLAAAKTVFNSRDATMIPLLERARTAEKDAGVADALTMALAATRLLSSKNTEQSLAAIDLLGGLANAEVRVLLARVAGTTKDAKIRTAAEAAMADIAQRIQLWEFAASIFEGVSLGSVLLLAAIGLAITFGVMGVINMAHGEMVMLGAYTAYVVQLAFTTYWPGGIEFSLLFAVPAAFLVAGAFGVVVERGIIRFLYGRPLETLLATWGLSLVLQQMVRSIFGPTNRAVLPPQWMSGAIEVSGAMTLTYNRIWIIVFSLVVFGLILLLLKRTDFGLRMRAVTQNRAMASSMGIRTGWVDAMTFGLGSGIAGMAGVALSQIDNVSPNLGQAYIIDSFMVVVFGGVGNLWGTLVGALSLGVVNKFLEPIAGAVLAKIFVLVAIILFIQKRPRGMFALKGRAVEN